MTRNILTIIVLSLFSLTAGAVEPTDSVAAKVPLSKAIADSAYTHEHYADAAIIYQALIDSFGQSAQLYYNLGNCYYRQDSIARAVLAYERALLLDPADRDIRFNLDMARSRTVDRVAVGSEMFFVTAYRSLVLSLSMHEWSLVAIFAFVLMLVAVCLYLFAPTLAWRRTGFYAAIVLLLLCGVANVAARYQRYSMTHRTGAIVMKPSAVVKSTPSASGTDLFILHEGTRVDLRDDSMREWVEVRLADGKQGWLLRSELEVI